MKDTTAKKVVPIGSGTPTISTVTRDEIAALTVLASTIEALVITDNATYQQAADYLSSVKERVKKLEEERVTITKPLDDQKKAVMDEFRPATTAIAACEVSLKQKMADFVREQKRKQAEIDAKAAAELRTTQDKLVQQAETARAAGKDEKADMLEHRTSTIVTTTTVVVPTAKGASSRTVWKARLKDKMALIKAVAEGRASHELLDFNEGAANKLASVLKATLNIDGLEPFEDVSIVSRSK